MADFLLGEAPDGSGATRGGTGRAGAYPAARAPNHLRRAGLAAAALLVALGAAVVRRTGRVVVVGDSMRPTLEAGDRVIILRGGRRARPGDVVVVPDPRQPRRTMIKRVASVDGPRCLVVGDNRNATTDSRHFGPVGLADIQARVVYRYFPIDRRGAVCHGASESAGDAQRCVNVWK